MTHVVVDVATVWTSPDAPREVDAAAVAGLPDVRAWTMAMDASPDPEARLGLHGRTLTQALRGEPVEVLATEGGWAEVVLPWQPSSSDPRGYRGWVCRAHLGDTGAATDDPGPGLEAATGGDAAERLIATARPLLGLRYLWGGTSRWGVDCSGLVHLAHRALGLTVPRDAFDQHPAAAPVRLDEAGRGDLYFFARPDGGRIFHVGLVTNDPGGTPSMLHAPEGGGLVEDVPLPPERRSTLVAAGRFLPPS